MQIICAWCGKNLGEKLPEIKAVTHGICEKCKKKELEQIAEREIRISEDMAREYLKGGAK